MVAEGEETSAAPGGAPENRSIMHFTHIDNLRQILADGVLYPDARVGNRLQAEVGDRDIKVDRRRHAVICEPGGYPADYVPFYFAPRSPMLHRIAAEFLVHRQPPWQVIRWVAAHTTATATAAEECSTRRARHNECLSDPDGISTAGSTAELW